VRTETFLFGMLFVGVLYLLWKSRSISGPLILGLVVTFFMSPKWSGSVRHALRSNGIYIVVIAMLIIVSLVNSIRRHQLPLLNRFVSWEEREKLEKVESVATGLFFVVFAILVIGLGVHAPCTDPEDCRSEP
jgi:hypothetical protein